MKINTWVDTEDIFKIQTVYLLETVNRVRVIEFFLDMIRRDIIKM